MGRARCKVRNQADAACIAGELEKPMYTPDDPSVLVHDVVIDTLAHPVIRPHDQAEKVSCEPAM
jgi:hypothetical protein